MTDVKNDGTGHDRVTAMMYNDIDNTKKIIKNQSSAGNKLSSR